MNNLTLQQFARNEIKEKLKQCRQEEINKFKRIYGEHDVNELDWIIDNIEPDELDHALTVVENTLESYD